MEVEAQIAQAVAVAQRCLGEALVAVWLYGSATGGGLRRWSDVDLALLVDERPAEPVRQALVRGWLPLSGAPGSAVRPLEVTVLALADLRPWRYPPWRVLQFGEWLRADFEAGILEPPQPDPDVALLVLQARSTGRALYGPAPAAVLDPVPMEDVRRAIADGVPDLVEDWRWDARNVLLTLARMWLTAATGAVLPKDRAADWAITRLPPDAAAWLARARADYLGLAAEDWAEAAAALGPTVERLAAETEASLGDLARPRRPVQRLA